MDRFTPHPEDDGFDGSEHDRGDTVDVLVHDPTTDDDYKRVSGTLVSRVQGVDVAREEDQTERKTLVWVKGMEGYLRPHPSIPGQLQETSEAWFAEEDLRPPEEDVLDNANIHMS